jgi:hypothetical protein
VLPKLVPWNHSVELTLRVADVFLKLCSQHILVVLRGSEHQEIDFSALQLLRHRTPRQHCDGQQQFSSTCQAPRLPQLLLLPELSAIPSSRETLCSLFWKHSCRLCTAHPTCPEQRLNSECMQAVLQCTQVVLQHYLHLLWRQAEHECHVRHEVCHRFDLFVSRGYIFPSVTLSNSAGGRRDCCTLSLGAPERNEHIHSHPIGIQVGQREPSRRSAHHRVHSPPRDLNMKLLLTTQYSVTEQSNTCLRLFTPCFVLSSAACKHLGSQCYSCSDCFALYCGS